MKYLFSMGFFVVCFLCVCGVVFFNSPLKERKQSCVLQGYNLQKGKRYLSEGINDFVNVSTCQ